ncbi:MAG: cyanophycin synthetase [Vicinamibacterales bacterium]
MIGRANLANVLCAMAVATELGVPPEEAAARARDLAPARHRGEVRRLGGGVTVVDDSYNASPAALKQALDTLSRQAGDHRRVAVLGEMLELGDRADELHRSVGHAAQVAGVGLLVTVGGAAAAAMADAAVAAGLPADAVHHVATSTEAADVMAGAVRPGDIVLVKGSRGVKTEVVVDRLVAVCG